MDFISAIRNLNNNAIISFENSDIALAKYRFGIFCFFKKNLQPVCNEFVYVHKVVTDLKKAQLPAPVFINDILLRFYKQDVQGRTVIPYSQKSHAYNYCTILSCNDYANYFQQSKPNFWYIPVFVEYVESAHLQEIIKNANLKPCKIETVDNTSVAEDLKNAILDFGNKLADAANKLINGPKTNTMQIDNKKETLKKELLECDHVRANLEIYNESILTQPNLGHWDLFGKKEDDCLGFYARDPKKDINDRVIGIDFGTKSTVVYYLNSNNGIFPLPVGAADRRYNDNKRYENPTVLHFLSLNNFLKAYKDKIGRPDTKWSDLTSSHKAKDEYIVASSEYYCSFLSQLKQWANNRKPQNFKAQNDNNLVELKPFLELKENDINPIEYYAYYIGLYINNMHNTSNIYFDYYLSFPVTYEQKVKEKICESFERGLKKSLPPSLLNDAEVMEKFKVRSFISEPMAYAACALQEFGIKEFTNYAVFDFGGGTTDFDFGTWEKVEGSKKYDYQIMSFGGEGIATCGGENILEDLAFELFKQNIDNLGFTSKKYFPFIKGPNSQDFRGSETFCKERTDQNASTNTHIIVERLRKFWEESEKYLDGDELPEKWSKDKDDNTKISVTETLYDNNGQSDLDCTMSVSKDFLRDFIQDKISRAVKSFFDALNKWNCKYNSDTVNIFLAGNSSKSPYVTKCFNDEVEKNKDGNNLQYILYPPLGTKEAVDKIKENNPEYVDNGERPTCKSGVAFGLISCRKGGKIKILKNEEIATEQFAFYIGYESEQKFQLLETNTSNRRMELNQWYEFYEAEEGDENFEFYYTDNANCIDGNLPITEVKRKKCQIICKTDGYIYLRATTPHTVQYAIAADENSIDKTETVEL